MAQEVERLFRETDLIETGIFVMGRSQRRGERLRAQGWRSREFTDPRPGALRCTRGVDW